MHTRIHRDTYTCTYRHALIHTRTDTCTHACIHMHTHAHTDRHACTHMHTQIHMHTETHTHVYTDMHTHIHTRTHAHTCTHRHAPMHTHTYTPTLIKRNNFQSVYLTTKLAHPDQPSFQVSHQTPREAHGLLTSQWWALRAFWAELTALLCTLCCDITAVGAAPGENPAPGGGGCCSFSSASAALLD